MLRDLAAERDAELERLRTSLAVLQRPGAGPAAAVIVTGDPAGGKQVREHSRYVIRLSAILAELRRVVVHR